MSAHPKPYRPPEVPAGKINLTDPDSKLVHGMRGWIQGYSAQAVCNERHLIVAAEVMTPPPDFGHLAPMLTAARSELAAAGATANLQVVVADAGYWHLQQINEITGQGIPVLIPPALSRRATTRPGCNGGAYDFMRSLLATELGSRLSKQHAQLIEPIFGDTKHNRGFTRFARPARSAARTEWRLIATTHNLRKLHQHLTAPASSPHSAAGARRRRAPPITVGSAPQPHAKARAAVGPRSEQNSSSATGPPSDTLHL
jgi:hypothetical protein